MFALITAAASVMQAQAAAPSGADADARANAILGKMTPEQKIDLLGGTEGFFVRGYDELGVKRLKMADGPMGVRNFGPSTAFPAGIALAASWNKDLARQVGEGLGRDARAKGVHFLLGPGVNIYRAPMNGRNFEYFGEDPYLTSRVVVNYVNGVQSQGVIATIKHYAANNSEFDRHNTNSEVDERTLREIYFPSFEAAVKEAHVGAIMDSYNLINGQHATQNGFMNVQVAKKDWGFDGIIMSDWDATYDGVAAANNGLDLEMPDAKFMNKRTLLPAIQQGKVSQATIDDHVRRILRTAIRFGFYDRDQTAVDVPRYNEQDREVALQGARESIVLLKNEGSVLPLDKNTVKTIAVFGPDAYPAQPAGGGSAHVEPFNSISYLEGLSNYLGTKVKVLYNPGLPSQEEIAHRSGFVQDAQGKQPGLKAEHFQNGQFSGTPDATGVDESIDQHTGRAFGPNGQKGPATRWTGYIIPRKSGAYRWFAKASGNDTYQLFVNDKLVLEQKRAEGQVPQAADVQMQAGVPARVRFEYKSAPSWLGSSAFLGALPIDEVVTEEAKKMAQMADAAFVFVGYDPSSESEGSDRTFKLPPSQDDLVKQISALNKKTAVVITAGGNVDMTQWVDQVPTILHGWYSGQEDGRALAEIAFGDVNPSGKLPITLERRWEDNPAHDSYYPNDPSAGPTAVKYNEGVFVGYRGYEKNGTKPLFPFGHGLSYTTFAFKNVSASPQAARVGQPVTVTFDVTNTGQRAGAEVAQVYVGEAGAPIPRPAKELKGFEKVMLQPGETKHVTVTLDARAMSYFDVNSKSWKQDPAKFTVYVGDSSANANMTTTYAVSR